MSKIKDLTGQRFGRLVVLYKNGTAKMVMYYGVVNVIVVIYVQ